jgi:hypothetical protein
MSKVRKCFVCSRLLARSERQVAEATTRGVGAAIVEVCDKCQRGILRAGRIATCRKELTVVLRRLPVQRQLFPAASSKSTGTGGRDG